MLQATNSENSNPADDKALAIQSIKEFLQQRMVEKPELRDVIQKILTQPEKFDALAETCSLKTSRKRYRTRIGLNSFFKVSDEQYILPLTCYTGAYQPGSVYFLFTQSGGIQTKPLVLTRLIGYKTGKLQEIPYTDWDDQSIAGYQKFDDEKKELSLTYRCDGPWSCFAISKYVLVDDQLVLQEYVIGSSDIAEDNGYATRHFVTRQFVRMPQGGWSTSEVKRCRGVGLDTCTEATKPQ